MGRKQHELDSFIAKLAKPRGPDGSPWTGRVSFRINIRVRPWEEKGIWSSPPLLSLLFSHLHGAARLRWRPEGVLVGIKYLIPIWTQDLLLWFLLQVKFYFPTINMSLGSIVFISQLSTRSLSTRGSSLGAAALGSCYLLWWFLFASSNLLGFILFFLIQRQIHV